MSSRNVLCIGAHPDDNEFSVGGTAARLAARGDRIHFVSVTNGDRGHFADEYRLDRTRLADRRLAEAKAAAAIIGATYRTLGVHDGEVYVDRENTEEIIRCIRSVGEPGEGPDLVLFNRPVDYHRDHRYTAQLVLDATYMLTVPLICPEIPHLRRMPVFGYWFDDFTEAALFRADVVVPIDDVMDKKVDMLCAHESQVFEWLPYNMGKLAAVPPPEDPEGRRMAVAEWVTSRAEFRREKCRPALGASDAHYVEAFQICEYGRKPGEAEVRDLFGV